MTQQTAQELRLKAQIYRDMAENAEGDPARWTRLVDHAAFLDRQADEQERTAVHEYVRKIDDSDPFCGKCGEHRDEGVHDPINAECTCAPEDGDFGSGYHFESCPRSPKQPTVVELPTAVDYLALAKEFAMQAQTYADAGEYAQAQRRHRDAADAFAAYERMTAEESKPCTHPNVIVIGDNAHGICQKCGLEVRTPRADEHFADADGNRAMWVIVTSRLSAQRAPITPTAWPNPFERSGDF